MTNEIDFDIYDDTIEYCVQETIGGWRQNPIFTGNLDQCREYICDCNGNFAIVPKDECEVDYL